VPLIWLWAFVAECGATTIDDALASEVLKVQVVRARDRHALQGRHAHTVNTLLNMKMEVAATGQGGLALVEGEFGSGKTAVVCRFVSDVMPASTSVFAAAGSPYTRGLPYAVWAELLQRFLREYRDLRGMTTVTDAAAEVRPFVAPGAAASCPAVCPLLRHPRIRYHPLSQ
jgi:hypothetical protein